MYSVILGKNWLTWLLSYPSRPKSKQSSPGLFRENTLDSVYVLCSTHYQTLKLAKDRGPLQKVLHQGFTLFQEEGPLVLPAALK